MEDKCPNCGETLITMTIQKKLSLGSIDFPVAQICQKCNWSRDLTEAGDIVVKPPSEKKVPEKPRPVPEKNNPDMNKIITIALALLVIAGIIWAFIPKGTEQPGAIQPLPTPLVTETTKDGLFEKKLLDNGKQTTPYLFKNTGTYTFDIVILDVKKFSGTVVVEP